MIGETGPKLYRGHAAASAAGHRRMNQVYEQKIYRTKHHQTKHEQINHDSTWYCSIALVFLYHWIDRICRARHMGPWEGGRTSVILHQHHVLAVAIRRESASSDPSEQTRSNVQFFTCALSSRLYLLPCRCCRRCKHARVYHRCREASR